MSKLSKNIVIFVLVILALSGLLYFVQFPTTQPKEIGVQAFISQVNEGLVRKVEIEGNTVTVTLNDEVATKQVFQKEPQDSISALFDLYNVSPEKRPEILVEGSGESIWFSSVLPIALPIILFAVIIFFFFRQIQGANNRAMTFGQSGARQVDTSKKDRVTFKDVAGANEAKE